MAAAEEQVADAAVEEIAAEEEPVVAIDEAVAEEAEAPAGE